jgi:hypothetical protein
MGKMETTFDDKLPAFQKYLLEKNLAPAKNVPFYAHWVSRFLDYARRNEFSALEYQKVDHFRLISGIFIIIGEILTRKNRRSTLSPSRPEAGITSTGLRANWRCPAKNKKSFLLI